MITIPIYEATDLDTCLEGYYKARALHDKLRVFCRGLVIVALILGCVSMSSSIFSYRGVSALAALLTFITVGVVFYVYKRFSKVSIGVYVEPVYYILFRSYKNIIQEMRADTTLCQDMKVIENRAKEMRIELYHRLSLTKDELDQRVLGAIRDTLEKCSCMVFVYGTNGAYKVYSFEEVWNIINDVDNGI